VQRPERRVHFRLHLWPRFAGLHAQMHQATLDKIRTRVRIERIQITEAGLRHRSNRGRLSGLHPALHCTALHFLHILHLQSHAWHDSRCTSTLPECYTRRWKKERVPGCKARRSRPIVSCHWHGSRTSSITGNHNGPGRALAGLPGRTPISGVVSTQGCRAIAILPFHPSNTRWTRSLFMKYEFAPPQALPGDQLHRTT
jgi:hypothetical protein